MLYGSACGPCFDFLRLLEIAFQMSPATFAPKQTSTTTATKQIHAHKHKHIKQTQIPHLKCIMVTFRYTGNTNTSTSQYSSFSGSKLNKDSTPVTTIYDRYVWHLTRFPLSHKFSHPSNSRPKKKKTSTHEKNEHEQSQNDTRFVCVSHAQFHTHSLTHSHTVFYSVHFTRLTLLCWAH